MDKNLPEDFALLCDLRSTRHGPLTPETIRLLKKSVFQKKYAIYYSTNGRLRGYAAWADINIESLLRIIRRGNFPRYVYEWSEGNIRLIIDVLMHTRRGDSSIGSIMSELTEGAAMVAFVRRSRLKIYEKKDGTFKHRPANSFESLRLPHV